MKIPLKINHSFSNLTCEILDFHAIESLAEFRSIIEDKTFIFAVDKKGSRASEIIFGKEVIQAVSSGVIPPQEIIPVGFAIDWDTEESEFLCAAVQVVKGFHEADTE
jgi:hypothetical protein